MLLLLLFVSLSLFLAGEGQSADGFLPGSCADAGYSGCCTDTICAGEPETCYCDISCYDFYDCCSDMEWLCPPGSMPPPTPLYLMAMEITFHTARIYWTLTANTSNETYSVKYYPQNSVNGFDELSVLVPLNEMNNCADFLNLEPCLILMHLQPNTTYRYSVLATNLAGSEESKTDIFTTLDYAPVQHVQAKVLNRTAVRISWAPLWVPEGVSLLQYSIYSSTSHGASTPHGGFSASEMGGQIAGLLSEKVYSFWVVAHIQDADGSIMETPPSFVTPESTVFVPDMALIQLSSGPLLPCGSWNAKTDNDITEVFHSALLQALRDACGCSYSRTDITNEQVLCVPPTHAVYRATIASTMDYTVGDLLHHLETWVASAPELKGTASLNSKCPVRITLRSEPVCELAAEPPDTKPCECGETTTQLPSANIRTEPQNSSDSESCVAIGVLIVSLVAELLLILVLLMIGIIVFLCWTRRGRKASLDQEPQSSEPNIYVHHLEALSHSSHISSPVGTTSKGTSSQI